MDRMDIVITYVDFTCPQWRQAYDTAFQTIYDPVVNTCDSATRTRFVNHGEIRFVLRSIDKYVPNVRTVYLVVDDMLEVPSWLQNVTIVRHKDLFQEFADSCLPTFNSQAIETVLHRIPGISDPFLYFNDDMFVGKPVSSSDLMRGGSVSVILSNHKSRRGVPNRGEIGFRCAWKNVNRLLDETVVVEPRYKLEHAPYVVSPAIMEELWSEFYLDMERTIRSRFRSIHDINVSPALHPYFALYTGRGFVQTQLQVQTVYLDLSRKRETRNKLRIMKTSAPHFFCLEDEDGGTESDGSMRQFLEELFSEQCRYESEDLAEQQPESPSD